MPRAIRVSKITETQEQKVVVAYLRKFGFSDQRVLWTHIRAERAGLWQALEAKRMGVQTKFPDLMFIHGTNRGWIEMKERGWKAQKSRTHNYNEHELAQLKRHDELRANGDWVEICETLDEVVQTLNQHGMWVRMTPISTERIRAGAARASK
jgi:hypothetical protein